MKRNTVCTNSIDKGANAMKRFFTGIIFLLTIYVGTTNMAMSDSFKKMISFMNVPIKNIDGYEINEDIYQRYSLIVYGTPNDVTRNQRWKNVATGKWINESTGEKGEYRILGFSVTGTVVNNELFPDDYTSGTSPEEWNYIPIGDALSSWNDTEKYQTKEQLQYMLTQKWNRNGNVYQLTAQSVGLEKARLEAYATWKTAGSIFTLKKDIVGNIWEATFRIPPMAADANLIANLDFINGEKYQFEEGQEELEIPIRFGAEVTNLGEYAHATDIQSISAKLEVENNLTDQIQSENITMISKENKLIIHQSDYPNTNKVVLTIKNTSVLETCFHSEAPMVSIKEKTIEIVLNNQIEEDEGINIQVQDVNSRNDNDVPRPSITGFKLYRKTITNSKQKLNLMIAKKTNTQLICAGQILVVEAQVANNPQIVTFSIEGNSKIQTLDDLTKKFVYEEPRARGEKGIYSSFNELKASYQLPRVMQNENGVYRIEYIIPYGTKQTLHSWNTLRALTNNALEIDKTKLFSRISNPYVVKIYAKNSGGSITRSIDLDVFERWDTIYNRDLSEYVK